MPEKNDKILSLKSPWSDNDNTIWLASDISLRRNVEKFKFPAKMNLERRSQLISLISKDLLSNSLLKSPLLIKAEDLTPLEKEFMSEHYLSTENFQPAHSGEAFVIDETGAFLASLNLQDHIHLQTLDIKGEVETSWSKLVKIENQLGKAISYSYSNQFGFLTADPFDCGTGLSVSLFLQPSALIHTGKINEFLEANKDDTIEIKNFLIADNLYLGDIVIIANNYSLGISEESIMASARNFSTKLIAAETSLRQKLAAEESAEIKDKVSRAYAILIHSYQIEAIEALNAIALLKLGSDLKWISGLSTRLFNELFFNSRRAHLLHQTSEKIPQDQIPHKRAEFIHKALSGLKLEI